MRPVIAVALVLSASLTACDAEDPASPIPPPTTQEIAAARDAWSDVYSVLTHPRCMNCHPSGDAPLQTDDSTVHKWGVNRDAIADGLQCNACHQAENAEAYGLAEGPPGAPNWHFPPADTPMIFQGRDPAALCAQFHDEQATGGRDLDALLEHVNNESLVLWAWNPGGDRTTPPLTHDAFLEAFAIWVRGGGACPEDPAMAAQP